MGGIFQITQLASLKNNQEDLKVHNEGVTLSRVSPYRRIFTFVFMVSISGWSRPKNYFFFVLI